MSRPLTVIILLFVAGTVAFFGVWPRYQTYAELHSEAEGREAELQNRENYYADLASIEQQLEQYSSQTDKVAAAIPDDTALPSLYDLMQKVSSAAGLVVQSVSISPGSLPEAGLDAKPIEISLGLSGTYPSVKQFLANLERSSRLLEAKSVNFTSPAQGQEFTFNVRLRAYSY